MLICGGPDDAPIWRGGITTGFGAADAHGIEDSSTIGHPPSHDLVQAGASPLGPYPFGGRGHSSIVLDVLVQGASGLQ